MNSVILQISVIALFSLGLLGCQRATESKDSKELAPYTYVSGPSVSLQKVQYDTVGEFAMIEEDIILGTVEEAEAMRLAVEENHSRGAVAIPTAASLWKEGTIYYEIDPNIPKSNRILDAFEVLQETANVHFKPRKSELDFVSFVYDEEETCSSAVGRKGGKQIIRLADRCTMWSTVHEVLHALGLWHEQSREDRDKFIKINWDNIKPGKAHNFELKSKQNLIGVYDFSSLMHYSFKAFSKNGLPTMVRKGLGSDAAMGQREKLSEGDGNALRKLYGRVR